VSLVRIKVVRSDLVRGDELAPTGCHAFRPTPRYLHDESATVLIELDGQEIDASILRSPKVRKRPLEASRPKSWNKSRLQRGIHVVATHEVWLTILPFSGGAKPRPLQRRVSRHPVEHFLAKVPTERLQHLALAQLDPRMSCPRRNRSARSGALTRGGSRSQQRRPFGDSIVLGSECSVPYERQLSLAAFRTSVPSKCGPGRGSGPGVFVPGTLQLGHL
jgi:hypothetical protein